MAHLGLVCLRVADAPAFGASALESFILTGLFLAFPDLYAFHILKLGASHIGAAVFDSRKIRRSYKRPGKICSSDISSCQGDLGNFNAAQICAREVALREIGPA